MEHQSLPHGCTATYVPRTQPKRWAPSDEKLFSKPATRRSSRRRATFTPRGGEALAA